MSQPKILQVLPMYHQEGEKILRQGAEVIQTNCIEIPHLCKMVEGVDGIVLRAPARITREIIDAATSVKVISGAGVGLDNIDVNYATQKKIPVLHAPSVNGVSTAEHALMFIIALSKSLIPFHEEMRKGNYDSRTMIQSQELRGKRAGLVGFGTIGREVARRLKLGLDMEVTAWIREKNKEKQERAEALGINLTTDLEEVFSEADFVSLHIPLCQETRGLITGHYFSLMKPTSYFVNTARGALVNQDDLYHALKEGKIAGAGLDVFDPEPPAKDLALFTLPNVLLTPHVGGTTIESKYFMAKAVATNLLSFFAGEPPKYIANPEIL